VNVLVILLIVIIFSRPILFKRNKKTSLFVTSRKVSKQATKMALVYFFSHHSGIGTVLLTQWLP